MQARAKGSRPSWLNITTLPIFERPLLAQGSRSAFAPFLRGLSFKIGGGNVVTINGMVRGGQSEFDEAFSILETALAECET